MDISNLSFFEFTLYSIITGIIAVILMIIIGKLSNKYQIIPEVLAWIIVIILTLLGLFAIGAAILVITSGTF